MQMTGIRALDDMPPTPAYYHSFDGGPMNAISQRPAPDESSELEVS